ncbi:MAG TPA: transglutaminaseTgpA domain-containing protein [Gemmataceae bacterium]|nr:transglutaminaseTgpA domain-containing protein [Gemmataceae bacterium]
MRLDNAFRLSIYCCLVLASLCLTYAEQLYLPAFFVFGLGFSVFLGAAYFLEGRWSLSLLGANLLGGGIGIGACAWLIYHILHPWLEVQTGISGAVALLPFVGPVLMVLVAAKLLRPKQVSDFWGLHSLGLLEVVLACVLAGQPIFGLLLVIYVISLLWSLTLFYLYRTQLASIPQRRAALPPASANPRLPWRLGGVRPAAWWAGLVLGLGFLLFLLTPQRGTGRWDPGVLGGTQDMPLSTGSAATIDLNRTGTLKLDDRLAFEVDARYPDGRPVLNLNPWQRWHGATVDYYDRGRWTNRAFPVVVWHDIDTELRLGSLPDPGPSCYLLDYTLDTRRINRMILAEPLRLASGTPRLPVAFFSSHGNWLVGVTPDFPEGEFNPSAAPQAKGRYRYVQAVIPTVDPNWSQAFDYEIDNLTTYCQQPVPGIRTQADRIVQQLIAAGRLSKADFAMTKSPQMTFVPDTAQPLRPGMPITGRPVPADPNARILEPANREKVARAVCEYLATSGEYKYSLSHRRSDLSMDPTEDFLCNVKEGHCERFATALALLLRSYGIPTRIVLGFQGQEHEGEGHYVIRNSRAHSWVQVQIKRSGRKPKEDEYYWLTLDPVPSGATDVVGETSADLWRRFELYMTDLWRGYVLDYDEDHQQSAATALWQHVDAGAAVRELLPLADGFPRDARAWLKLTCWIAVFGGIGFMLWRWRLFLRRGSARRAETVPGVKFYARLLRVLEKYLQLKPRTGLTPGEFAATAADTVCLRTGASTAGETVRVLAAQFYAVRYGGRLLAAHEAADIDRRLSELETALAEKKS